MNTSPEAVWGLKQTLFNALPHTPIFETLDVSNFSPRIAGIIEFMADPSTEVPELPTEEDIAENI